MRVIKCCAMLGVAAALAVMTPAVVAQEKTQERFTAIAVNMNVGRMNTVDIVIDRWSPAGDREALLAVFLENGQDAMLKELLKRPRLGFIRLPETLGHDLHFAMDQPLPDGGRRVIVVTDRPIGMREARNAGRSMDYPFTMLEIRFDSKGAGVGKMSTGTQIGKSKDGKHLELETWDNQPVRFTQVKSQVKTRK
jgi:hypothetical protein